jgi:diguanylate cyclase (GGDEF)-like protein
VLFLDVDRFKVINDSLGHLIGDQLLIAFARRLEGCVRETDTVAHTVVEPTIARLGGDEFTVLLEGIDDPGDALRVAERIHRVLAVPFSLDGYEVFATVSIGIALGGSGYDLPEDLLRDADTAMYDAKGRGRARCEVFDSAMHTRAVARLEVETELRWALERQEFRLHYQPIVEMGTGHPIGFEALLRWEHPRHGLIPSSAFIPVAEETGLIVPIGWWVLEEACRQMGEWHARYPDTVSSIICVNLSSKQFFQVDLVEQIERRLRAAGLKPDCLKLEITESAIMSDPRSAADALTQLRDLGVRIAVDDFGTGHSSLSYLQQFPIDTLKIDRSFVQKMAADIRDREIIQAVITLAHNLGMNVVAEGVETNSQWNQLDRLGCEYGQGYYFSRPVDSADAESLLTGTLRITDTIDTPSPFAGDPDDSHRPAGSAPADREEKADIVT